MIGVTLCAVLICDADALDVAQSGLPRFTQRRFVLLLVLGRTRVVQVADLGIEFLGVLADRIHLGLEGLGGFFDFLASALRLGAFEFRDLGREIIALLLGHLVLLAELLDRSRLRFGLLCLRGSCGFVLLRSEPI